jgi:hypothetical protein
VLAGHVPHGDCPCVINGKALRMMITDTSYSSFGHKSPWGVDNRGSAVGEVVVARDGSVRAYGILADGSEYDYELAPVGGRGAGRSDAGGQQGAGSLLLGTFDEFVGRQLADGSWVKAKIKGKDEYVVCLGEGRKLTHRRMTAGELRSSQWMMPDSQTIADDDQTKGEHKDESKDKKQDMTALIDVPEPASNVSNGADASNQNIVTVTNMQNSTEGFDSLGFQDTIVDPLQAAAASPEGVQGPQSGTATLTDTADLLQTSFVDDEVMISGIYVCYISKKGCA